MSDNNNDVTSTLTGGVTRVQIGSASDYESGSGDTLRSGVSDGGAMSISADGQVKEFGAVAKHTVTHEVNPAHGVLASARSESGSRSAPITDKSIVTLRSGVSTSIANALNMGELRRDGPGRYIDTGFDSSAGTGGQPASSPTPAPMAAETPLHPASELAVDALANSVPHQLIDAITQCVAVHGAQTAIDRFAGNSTMSPADFAATVEAVEVGFVAHAAHALSKLEIDGPSFDAWARKNAASEYNSAKIVHAVTKSTAAYDALAKRYLSRTASSPEVIAEQGGQTRTNAKGVLEVRTPLGWVSMKAARAVGIVS